MFHTPARSTRRGNSGRLLALTAPLVFAGAVLAQALYGSLTGSVTDASNAAVAGATVTARNPDTGLTRTVTTDSSGNYNITDLPQGTYNVTIAGTGFGASETRAVPVGVNQTKRIDATLTIGGVNQSVDVNTAPPALQTDRADVSYEISARQVQQLPTAGSAGRNPENLFRLIPGIPPPQEMNSQAGNPGRNQAINANGVANTINSIKIDGAAVNYPWLQSEAAYIPPQDAIESVNVVTSSFNAEQGAAGGVAANFVVKSGTNSFHGGIWEYNSISQFNARNYFTRVTTTPRVPKNIYNEYGGNIGGPIIKDKLFFFFNYNKTSLRQFKNGNVFTVPQTQFRGGDFSSAPTTIYDPLTGNADGTGRTPFAGNIIPANRLSAPAVRLFALIPQPTNNAASTNNFAGGAVLAFDRGTYDTKINYNPTDKTTFFGRYSILRSQIVDPTALGGAIGNTFDGGQPGTAPGNIKNIGLGATHTFTPNFLIDANAGVVRIDLAAQGPDFGTNIGLNTLGIPGTNGATAFQSGFPGFIESQGLSNYGNYTQSNPFSFRDYQYVGNLNATYVRGSHTIRFGGEYTHSAINHLQTNGAGPRGQFTFSGGITGLNGSASGTPNIYRAIADNLLGLPNNVAKTVQLFQPNGPRFSEFGFFAQDTWKASADLTINYGVRYEYYPFATRDHTGVFRYDPASGNVLIGGRGNTPTDTGVSVGKGMLVPRFGINYRINDKTVIRSGFGITVDPENYRFYRDAYPALTTLSQTGVTGPTTATTFTSQYIAAIGLSAANTNTPSAAAALGGTLPVGVPTVVTPDISSGVVPLPYNYGTIFSPQKFRRGYLETFNLFVDRDLSKGLTASIGYVGTHQIRQVAGVDINAAPVSSAGNGARPIFANAAATGGVRRDTNGINNFAPVGSVSYSGLQFALNERQFKSLQFGYAFTWSHTLNTYDTNSTPGTVAFSSPQFFSRNYANSGFDRTFVNALWTNYQLPVGPGRQFLSSGFLGRLVGGFDLNAVMIYDSGTPFQLADGSMTNSGDQPVPYQISKLSLNGVKYNGANANFPQYFLNNGNLVKASTFYGTVQNGNVGRNSIRGPGLFNLDLGLSRNIPIFREYTLVLRGEAFDATNTPQWANPAADVNTTTTFGQITASNAARVLRISGRISF